MYQARRSSKRIQRAESFVGILTTTARRCTYYVRLFVKDEYTLPTGFDVSLKVNPTYFGGRLR